MPRPGTHWQGPLLGRDDAEGGLWDDAGPAVLSARAGFSYVDDFMEAGLRVAAAGTHWTLTNVVGGTAAALAGTHALRLSHNTTAQGPSIMWVGTHTTGVLYSGFGVAGTSAFSGFAAVEWRLGPSDITPAPAFFCGLTTVAAAHPLDAAGAINVAGLTDGVGWHWTNAGGTTPVLRMWTGGALVTISPTPTLSAWSVAGGQRRYGVRIDTLGSTDRVTWYLNGRRIHRQNLGASLVQFGSAMTPTAGLVQIGAGAVSVDIDYCAMAHSDRGVA